MLHGLGRAECFVLQAVNLHILLRKKERWAQPLLENATQRCLQCALHGDADTVSRTHNAAAMKASFAVDSADCCFTAAARLSLGGMKPSLMTRQQVVCPLLVTIPTGNRISKWPQ